MNPMALLKMKSAFDKFQKGHPKFVQFVQTIAAIGVKEGTIFECKVILPDGKEMMANLKISQEDLELFEKLKELSKDQK